MHRVRGWGLLLAVCVPLLLFFNWSSLGSEKSRVNLDRFNEWSGNHSAELIGPLVQHFMRHKKPAGPGDVSLPDVPKNSGIQKWALQPDTTLLLELDATVDGRKVVLRYVPLVRSATGILYDCVSATSAVQVGRFCQADVLHAESDIPAQLAANAQMLLTMPAVESASGVAIPAGTQAGTVVVVPQNAADLNHCGFQCVKPQSCVTPRPLACSKEIDTGNSGWLEIAATDYRGNSLATRSAADAACELALGAGYQVLGTSRISGVFKLAGGLEYWVHNDTSPEKNCWR
jgi:hypothetical protein